MTRRKEKAEVRKAVLIWDKTRFQSEIEQRVTQGKELLSINVQFTEVPQRYGYGYISKKQYDVAEFETFKTQMRKWKNLTEEILQQAFDIPNNEYHAEFSSAGYIGFATGNEDWLVEYKKEISQKIAVLESLLERLEYIQSQTNPTEIRGIQTKITKNVFVVHGHDEAKRSAVEAFIRSIGYNPIVLFKEPNVGQTIIEKIESNAENICFAIVIYTACDLGKAKDASDLKPRARQNVVFEHGYMCAHLSRQKVVALLEKGVEQPGDLEGVIYIDLDDAGVWQIKVAREMKAVGLDVDLNKIKL